MYTYNFKKTCKNKPLALDCGEWVEHVNIMKRKFLTCKITIEFGIDKTQTDMFLPFKNWPKTYTKHTT